MIPLVPVRMDIKYHMRCNKGLNLNHESIHVHATNRPDSIVIIRSRPHQLDPANLGRGEFEGNQSVRIVS